jgi:hypothetical protein
MKHLGPGWFSLLKTRFAMKCHGALDHQSTKRFSDVMLPSQRAEQHLIDQDGRTLFRTRFQSSSSIST